MHTDSAHLRTQLQQVAEVCCCFGQAVEQLRLSVRTELGYLNLQQLPVGEVCSCCDEAVEQLGGLVQLMCLLSAGQRGCLQLV